MKWYCEKCKKLHADDEMCPNIKKQLKEHPEWLSGAANFATVAAEEALITSQALDGIAQKVNKLAGTKLSYEGTHQFARDIQVFKRLNAEPFSRSGTFASPAAAKSYYNNILKAAQNTPRSLTGFESKLTGYSQEVDWLRMKHGQLSSLWEKSSLLSGNAPGVDAVSVNRFTGEEISRTTIKASKNAMTANSTGMNDVREAIAKGTATERDIIFGPKGTGEAARKAGLKNSVIEKNTPEQIQKSNSRLEQKIANGQATASVTVQQVGKKMAQGAVVGAAVAVGISTITNYIRYKNGELTREEAFREVGEDAANGALTGAALGAITIFLPEGIIGFAAGVAIGIYISKVFTNILDEVFGKGAWGAILNASGYVYGMTVNLGDALRKIERNMIEGNQYLAHAEEVQKQIEENFKKMERRSTYEKRSGRTGL